MASGAGAALAVACGACGGPSARPAARPTETCAAERAHLGTVHGRGVPLVFLGDSYTAGVGAPVPVLPEAVAAGLHRRVLIYGLPGAGFTARSPACGLTLGAEAASLAPGPVIVQGGLNDEAAAPAVVAGAASDLLTRLPDTVALVGPAEPSARDAHGVRIVDAVLRQVAAQHHVRYVSELDALLPGHPDLVGPDARHPTAAGYAALAARVVAALR